jgi:hypothetical protein
LVQPSQPISINIRQKFLALLDLELMKVINRNNVKALYSTMPNMEHNAKMWKKKKQRRGECSQTANFTVHLKRHHKETSNKCSQLNYGR